MNQIISAVLDKVFLNSLSLEGLIHSDAHQRVIAAAEARIKSTCSSCSYFGSCSGYLIAEGTVEYNEYDENGAIRCVVTQGTLKHIETRLQQTGIIDPKTRELQVDRLPQPSAPALLSALV